MVSNRAKSRLLKAAPMSLEHTISNYAEVVDALGRWERATAADSFGCALTQVLLTSARPRGWSCDVQRLCPALQAIRPRTKARPVGVDQYAGDQCEFMRLC